MTECAPFPPEGLPLAALGAGSRAGSRSALPRVFGRVPRSAWFLLLSGAAGCGGATAAPSRDTAAPQTVLVRLAPVSDTTIVQPVTGTGVLGAKEEVPLGFKIGGVIGRMLVNEGEAVATGQLLATLELPEIAGEVAKAAAGLGQAERDLARAAALYADSVIPQNAYEGATTAVEVARANLEIARFNQRYAAIRAPTAGTILRRAAEPGQQIAGGVPVLVLASAGAGQVVRVGLADRDVARISIGDRALVRFDSKSGVPLGGRVTQIAAQATPGTGAWVTEIRLDARVGAAGGGIASGLIGAVEIAPRRAAPVRLIPLAAVLEGDADSAVVYTIARGPGGSEARRHRVLLAFLTGDQAAVRSGLDGAGAVVTEGAAYLEDGSPVRAMESEPRAQGGAP